MTIIRVDPISYNSNPQPFILIPPQSSTSIPSMSKRILRYMLPTTLRYPTSTSIPAQSSSIMIRQPLFPSSKDFNSHRLKNSNPIILPLIKHHLHKNSSILIITKKTSISTYPFHNISSRVMHNTSHKHNPPFHIQFSRSTIPLTLISNRRLIKSPFHTQFTKHILLYKITQIHSTHPFHNQL